MQPEGHDSLQDVSQTVLVARAVMMYLGSHRDGNKLAGAVQAMVGYALDGCSNLTVRETGATQQAGLGNMKLREY